MPTPRIVLALKSSLGQTGPQSNVNVGSGAGEFPKSTAATDFAHISQVFTMQDANVLLPPGTIQMSDAYIDGQLDWASLGEWGSF